MKETGEWPEGSTLETQIIASELYFNVTIVPAFLKLIEIGDCPQNNLDVLSSNQIDHILTDR